MRVSLHATASSAIGWGHYFRLSALGEELVRRGHDVFFCLETDDQRLSARLSTLGITCVSESYVRKLRDLSIAIVDEYQPKLEYFWGLRLRGTTVVQIVDSGSQLRIPGALLVRPDPLPPGDVDLSGLKYALIASDVAKLVAEHDATASPVVSIIVGGAGSPLEGEIERVLVESGLRNVVRLRDLMPPDLVDRSDYLRAMSSSQVCVCGAGTTLWECFALGIPAVAVIVAENQRPQAEWADTQNLCKAIDQLDLTGVVSSVRDLLDDGDLRISMRERMRSLVDARGSSRIADRLEQVFGSESAPEAD